MPQSDSLDLKIDLKIPIAFEGLYQAKRYKVYYGGRGGAKSWAFADTLLIKAIEKPLRILCTRELQISITDSVHKLLSDRIIELGLQDFYEVQNKAIIGINGSEFFFKGLKHNSTEIKSTEGIDICWVEEAERVSEKSWEILIPTVRKEDSEIWVSFNTKNLTDATYKRFVLNNPHNSIVRKVSYKDNPFFPEVLEQERLDLQRRDSEAYNHVWEGEPDTRFSGGIYSKEMAKLQANGHIAPNILYDDKYPVYTLWDLGYSDTTAIWFYQIAPKEILFIDYYENNSEGIGFYCDVLKAKQYSYHAHYVPQDAGKKLMEANGRSIVEQAYKDHGIRMNVIPETTHANRNNALRKILSVCWFNSQTCAEGLEAVIAYHYEYDEDLQVFKKIPVHDWSSHASCALELLPSVWTGKPITQNQLEVKRIKNQFISNRRKFNVDKSAPYRVKPILKK